MREVKWTYFRCGGALCPAIVQAHMAAVEREAAHLARYWLILGLWGWIACAGLRMHNLGCGLGSHRAFAPFVAAGGGGGGRCCKGGAGEEGGGGGEARRRIPPKAPSSDASLSDGGGSEGSDSGAAPIESPSKRPRRRLVEHGHSGCSPDEWQFRYDNLSSITQETMEGCDQDCGWEIFFFPSKEFAAVGLCIEGVGSRKSKILSISKMEKRRQTGHKVKVFIPDMSRFFREKGTRCTPHLTLKGNASTQLFFLGLASPRLCPSPLPLDSSTSAPNLPFRVRASIPPCSHHPIWGPV
uniref:S-acyltransferase n=1 Tax=Oryza barthii TaxID=65489 RepID=A0A0D3G831_9ORYZ